MGIEKIMGLVIIIITFGGKGFGFQTLLKAIWIYKHTVTNSLSAIHRLQIVN